VCPAHGRVSCEDDAEGKGGALYESHVAERGTNVASFGKKVVPVCSWRCCISGGPSSLCRDGVKPKRRACLFCDGK